MFCRKFFVLLALLVTSSIAFSHQEVITVPPDLSPGEQYRLVFVTKDAVFKAESSNIEDYDAWVSEQAATSPALNALTEWRVIGSTSSVSAKIHTDTDNTPVGPNGVPIYRLDGAVIAYNYDDLWDGAILNNLNITQDGGATATCGGAWTGTRANGTALPGDELGAVDGSVVDGALCNRELWMETSPYWANVNQYLYAISDVLTVPMDPIEVDIKVRPGSDNACNGVLPIAILGSDVFDVSQIDPHTLSFEGLDIRKNGQAELSCNIEDVNYDGYADFICRYSNGATSGTMSGELLDGTPIAGAGSYCVAH